LGWYCCFIIHSFPFFLLSLLPTFSSRDSSQHDTTKQQQGQQQAANTPSSHEYNRHLPAGTDTTAANTHPAAGTASTTTPSSQYTKQATHQAPHKYPLYLAYNGLSY
jgi:hypothetical protein